MRAGELLGLIDEDVRAELALAGSSGADGTPHAEDASLPFDAAAVTAYKVRLAGLHDAVSSVGVSTADGCRTFDQGG